MGKLFTSESVTEGHPDKISTRAYVDISKVVRDTIREIGYDRSAGGFDADSIAVLTSIDEQSADIALGVDQAYESRQEGATEDFGTGAGGHYLWIRDR